VSATLRRTYSPAFTTPEETTRVLGDLDQIERHIQDAILHGLDSVRAQIHRDLMDLRRVTRDGRGGRLQPASDRNVGWQGRSQHTDRFFNERLDGYGATWRASAAAEQ
jgi:hypothetical protein